MNKRHNLIWIDTEFTDLDFSKNKIVEIAVVVTDSDLKILDKGIDLVIHQDEEVLENMAPWCIEHFGESGLTQKIRESRLTSKEAENKILDYLENYTEKGKSPICGNSIGQDRKILFREMYWLEHEWASYRSIDVSTIKELAKRWKPEIYEQVKKKGEHRAMDDILESIEELKIYKKEIFDEK